MMHASGRESKRSFYFPTKILAERFKSSARRFHVNGRVTLRATLCERRDGSAVRRDPRHVGGFTVTLRPGSFGAMVELAECARSSGSIPAPFSGGAA